MRALEQTNQFKRDLKRESKGPYRQVLRQEFVGIVKMFAEDLALDPKFRDHPLSGEWADYRDCHVKPDLVLIYRKPDGDTLQLVRLGSHGALGL